MSNSKLNFMVETNPEERLTFFHDVGVTLQKLYEEKQLVNPDATILCLNGDEVPVNSFMLLAKNVPMSFGTAGEKIFLMNKERKKTVQKILDFIHTGKTEFVVTEIYEIYSAAHQWKLESLINLIQHKFMEYSEMPPWTLVCLKFSFILGQRFPNYVTEHVIKNVLSRFFYFFNTDEFWTIPVLAVQELMKREDLPLDEVRIAKILVNFSRSCSFEDVTILYKLIRMNGLSEDERNILSVEIAKIDCTLLKIFNGLVKDSRKDERKKRICSKGNKMLFDFLFSKIQYQVIQESIFNVTNVSAVIDRSIKTQVECVEKKESDKMSKSCILMENNTFSKTNESNVDGKNSSITISSIQKEFTSDVKLSEFTGFYPGIEAVSSTPRVLINGTNEVETNSGDGSLDNTQTTPKRCFLKPVTPCSTPNTANKSETSSKEFPSVITDELTLLTSRKPRIVANNLQVPNPKQQYYQIIQKYETICSYVVTNARCGLVNVGNTCFLNVILQILSNLDELKEYFLEDKFLHLFKNYQCSDLTLCFAAFFNLYNTGKYDLINPKVLIEALKKSSCVKFMNGQQQDSMEFLNFFICQIDVDLKIATQFQLLDLFHYESMVDFTCVGCKQTAQKLESGSVLLLPVKLKTNQLSQLLDHYFDDETINERNCSSCTTTTVTKKQKLTKLPTLLAVQFLFDETTKRTTLVNFAKKLNLKKFCKNNVDCIYDLFAVIKHYGSMHSGHYSVCVKIQGTWFKFNDEKVRVSTEDEIINGACVLLFRKE